MKKYRWYLVLLLLVWTLPVLALVDPEPTTEIPPGWMADIQVWVSDDNSYHRFCKGALIAPQWVLSSGSCSSDPGRIGADPKFSVKLGADGVRMDVGKIYFSDDYKLALVRLESPSAAVPLAVSARTAAQLEHSELWILSQEKSLAVFEYFFNPGVSAIYATCKYGSSEFHVDDSYCFVRTKTTSSATLYKTTATVVVPGSSAAPSTALDKAAKIDLKGRLYLDFRATRSYPCLEDLGAPLLASAENGNDEIVGVVTGVGMAGGMPICGMSMYNQFTSAEAIRSFADRTYLKSDFETQCPATPITAVSYRGEDRISLTWNSIKGADGYKVHYTTRPGQVPIETIDMLDQTAINTALPRYTDYLVAVTAYNANCSSAPSKPLAVNVDAH